MTIVAWRHSDNAADSSAVERSVREVYAKNLRQVGEYKKPQEQQQQAWQGH